MSSRRQAREVIPARWRARAMRSWQRAANRLGYELHPLTGEGSSDEARRAQLMRSRGIDLVLDVGANYGPYALQLRHTGYEGRIVSFEPLGAAYSQLERESAEDPLWDCRRAALGSEEGTVTINVAGNSTSSSLLEMNDRHRTTAPESEYVSTEKVPVTRLDAIWDELAGPDDSVYLKLDVQGFELEALRGAEESLPKIRVVQAELSLVPLYEGAPLYRDLIDHMAERDFRLAGIEPVFADPSSGELLQADGIFVRD